VASGSGTQNVSLTGKRWITRGCDDAARDRLAGALGCSALVARLLVNRGLGEPKTARDFLAPDLHQLHDPSLLPDVDRAVERLRTALSERERVLVYGDFDADGVTSTALLLRFFRLIGLEARHYIPCRIEEGYGLNTEAIEAAAAGGVGLIVTVDCGVGAAEEVERARELGMDVIVTDHHEPGHHVARAAAVVNPKLTGSLYPFRELAGVGVAFKLAWAVAQSFSPGKRVTPEFRKFLLDAMGLVAMGTVADVVPLVGENRIFATFGLHALRESADPGINALIEQTGMAGKRIQPGDVAFKLGPRLNAAGRIAHADLCVELFTCESMADAEAIAKELDSKNRERQRVQADILRAVRRRIDQEGAAERRSIVLAHEDWHPGVVGIVASKIVEEWHRPTILLGIREGVARGSARSVPEFNLFEAVEACGELLLAYGGHEAAAGLSIEQDRLDEFRDLFEQHVCESIGHIEPCGLIEIDAEVDLAALDLNLLRELDRLAPFGEGNAPPALACSGVRVAGQPKLMGRRGQHVSFYARQGDFSLRAVGFGMGDLYEQLVGGDGLWDIAFEPRINDYRGLEEVELRLLDLRPR
jgi:single-stranded-DNA-specific exonuclease